MKNRGMSLLGVLAGIVVIGTAGALAFAYTRQAAPEAPTVAQPKEIRWLIAHKPTEVFKRAEETFADTLSKETNGSLILRMVKAQDLGLVSDDVPQDTAMDLLRNGSIEMSTLYTVALGYNRPAFWALTMPFMFDDYAQVQKALDNDVKTRIFATLDDSPVRALAFTLSGGMRIIATKNTPVQGARDLSGKKIITSGGPVAEATLRALGANPIAMSTSTGAIVGLDTADGVETTYSRFSSLGESSKSLRYVNETNHSLFATLLVINSDFFASLSPAQQEAVKKAAQAAAQVEREDSITLASTTRDNLRAAGMTIVEVPQKIRESMRTMTAGVAPSFASSTDPSIIAALQAAR